MICPFCKKEEKESRLYNCGTSSTLIGYRSYYDKDSKFHIHNPNQQISIYKCSNGHRFQHIYYLKCPTCNWVKEEEKIIEIKRKK